MRTLLFTLAALSLVLPAHAASPTFSSFDTNYFALNATNPVPNIRLNQPWNVKWWGAKGDGIANDTAALQSAINFASATTNAMPLFFPRGTYNITAPLIIPNGYPSVCLYGAGVEETRLWWKASTNGWMILVNTTNPPETAIPAHGSVFFTLSDMTLECNPARFAWTTNSANGLYLYGVNGSVVRNSRILDYANHAVVSHTSYTLLDNTAIEGGVPGISDSSGWKVLGGGSYKAQNCNFQYNGGASIEFAEISPGSGGVSASQIGPGNRFEFGNGIYYPGISNWDTLIIGNYFENCTNAIFTTGGTSFNNGLTIVGNGFYEGVAPSQVLLQDIAGLSMINNRFMSGYTLSSTVTNVFLQGNRWSVARTINAKNVTDMDTTAINTASSEAYPLSLFRNTATNGIRVGIDTDGPFFERTLTNATTSADARYPIRAFNDLSVQNGSGIIIGPKSILGESGSLIATNNVYATNAVQGSYVQSLRSLTGTGIKLYGDSGGGVIEAVGSPSMIQLINDTEAFGDIFVWGKGLSLGTVTTPPVGGILTTGYVAVGDYVRIPNSRYYYGRDAANIGDVAAIGIDASDKVSLSPAGVETIAHGALSVIQTGTSLALYPAATNDTTLLLWGSLYGSSARGWLGFGLNTNDMILNVNGGGVSFNATAPFQFSGGDIVLNHSHTPASSAETNYVGAITWDASYLYVWTATNVNKRVALTAW